MFNTDVQMGDRVILRGCAYEIVDAPRFVRGYGDKQMLEWQLRAVPAGLRTGIMQGPFRVWPDDEPVFAK